MDKFEFETTHSGTRYHCLATAVRHGLDYLYLVDLTAVGAPGGTNRISVRPAQNDCRDWSFTCEKGGDGWSYYSRALLEYIGEEIDKHNLHFII
jgi:hypothetical protein